MIGSQGATDAILQALRGAFGLSSWEQSTGLTPETFAVRQRRRRRLWLMVVISGVVMLIAALL